MLAAILRRVSAPNTDSQRYSGTQTCCQRSLLLGLVMGCCLGSGVLQAGVVVTGTSPAMGQAVDTNTPELLIDFSGTVDFTTATTDSIRIYRLGAMDVTPAADDTLIPISGISSENGGTRMRVSIADPLPDGDYAWVVYGSASSRSGPGNDLHFTHGAATLSLAAFQTLGAEFTWEAWIHLECCTSYGGHGFGAIFDVGQNGRDVPGAVLQHNTAAWNFRCYRPDDTSSQAWAADSVVLGTWQHIACSASGAGVDLYVDGELAASTPDACDIAAMQSSFQTAITGYTRWAGAYDYILGSIDEMRVWNVARSQAQIKATMHTPLDGTEPGLLIYHPLDEGSGTVLTDVSGNGFSGASGNAQWEASTAPLILMSSTALLGADAVAVDTDGDELPGGVLVSGFRVDTTPPKIIDVAPSFHVCPHVLNVSSIVLVFDDDMDPASMIPANVSLRSAGPDEMIGNGDDVPVPFTLNYSVMNRALSITPTTSLANNAHRIVVLDSVLNTSGIQLDGEYPGAGGLGNPLPTGNGFAGGSFILDFVVNADNDCNGTDIADACELNGNDINGNGIPDECEDCNENGLPDECDIDCQNGGGGCDVEGCGQSSDCNGNQIPDDCEILPGIAGLENVVLSPINGHYYHLTDTMNWPSAMSLAESLGGQLATIRNATENQWLLDTFVPLTSATQAHIGFTDAAAEGTWVWLSGEPVTYTNWGPGEPNDIGVEDNAILVLQAEGVLFSGSWNDVPASTLRPAIIEFVGNGDCNQNNVPDECDIASATSADCNENGIPDECEAGGDQDCNNDGISNLCEFYLGTATDCDENGVPDDCQLPGNDCNGNGILDFCEPDCNGNGVPDGCDVDPLDPDGDGNISDDCDLNGVPDECDGQLQNRALMFDGDDLVTIPMDLVHARTTLTFEAWFKTSASGVIFGYQNRAYPTSPSNYTPAVYVGTDGLLRGEFYMGSATSIITSVATVADGEWHHVALAARNNSQSLYLDGQLVGTLAGNINHLDMTHNQIGIGHSASNNWDGLGAGWKGFVGEIDDVRLWSSYRSQQQISENMLSIFEASPSDLLGRWRFNEGFGQTANDASSMGNHGVLGVSPMIDTDDPVWIASDTGELLDDCNMNGVWDACDITSGISIDCNENGVPDECEPGGQSDCDGDGTSDLCEFYLENDVDCNNDGTPDSCEISSGDCNENGLLDVCELQDSNFALDFNETNDFVRVPDHVDFRPIDELTIEAWIRPDSAGSFHSRIVRHAPFNGGGYILSFQQSGNGRVQLRIGNGSLGSVTPSDTVPTSTYFGSWHHVAGVYSANGNFARIFVDGVLKDELPAVGLLSVSNSDLSIGNYVSGGEQFDGLIDDVRIWTVARTQEQLIDGMSRPLNGNEPGLVGYWRFNEGVGQQVYDESPFHHDGVLGNDDLPAGDVRDPTWSAIASPIPVTDCNENGALDECDIADGGSLDCNENGIPDECEPGGIDDCNNDGISDLCEFYVETAHDCNGDGVPDECQLSGNDCNQNGILDECDANGNDCNADGIPNDCEIADGAADCNLNGIPDYCEVVNVRGALEFDGSNDYVDVEDGVWFEGDFTVEAWVYVRSIGNWARLLDFSNGGPNDNIICGISNGNSGKPFLQVVDGTTSGSPRITPDIALPLNQWTHLAFVARGTTGEVYLNGLLEASGQMPVANNVVRTRNYLGRSPFSGDAYANAIFDEIRVWNVARSQADLSAGMNLPGSADAIGLVAYWKLDDMMGQSIFDETSMASNGVLGGNMTSEASDPMWSEGGRLVPNDCNQNGELDECDIASESSEDCNANGIPDECEPGGLDDCDGNGVSDLCDLHVGTYADCNNDIVPDVCQLLMNDCNADGVPDECELAGNDCNANAVPDDCEIASGAPDCNANGVLDSCELGVDRHALHFDGSDYVYVPNSASLAISSSLTIELWARLNNPQGGAQMLLIKGNDNSGQDPYYLRVGGNSLEFGFNTDTNSLVRVLAPIGQYDWTQYHHIAGVFDDSANLLRIFIDGNLVGSNISVLNPLSFQDPHYLTIGGTVGAGMGLNGDIDEVRIWDVARTQAELTMVMDQQLVGNEPGLVANWRFDEGAGQGVRDASIYQNDGRLGVNSAAAGDNADPGFISNVAPLAELDCNENGVPDVCDIAEGTSGDCNANGTPDDCEVNEDCNANNVQDICDIAAGAADCDNDLVPDACQLSGGDCNQNSIPDVCEPGGNVDCNSNGMADLCDLVNGTAQDCNGNGSPDECDIAMFISTDIDNNGIPDECETEVRVMPVATLINPALTSEVRTDLPESINLVHEGSRYYLEVWVSDVGMMTQGISGVYVDVSFCGTTIATNVEHGGAFDFLPEGTIQVGKVDEFGAATFDSNVAVSPEWVRVGWIEMRPGEGSPCEIVLQPSQNGIGAPGPVDWAFVDLGALTLQVEPTTVSYDLNDDGFIGFGDFALFLGSWLQPVPPADPTHDFDCDGIVGPGDLSWFATGWQKNVDDPTILYPVCDEGRGGGSPSDVDFKATLIAVSNPTASDTATALPESIEMAALAETYYVELWVSDAGDIKSGVTSAYFDVTYPAAAVDAVGVTVADAWTIFKSGEVTEAGVVDEFGGSILEQGFAIEPEWTRIGVIEVVATGPAPAAAFTILPGATGSAAYARGLIPWTSKIPMNVSVTQGIRGDIDGDNDVDPDDIVLFSAVLLARDVFGDLNHDGAINGLDIAPFVDAFLEGQHSEADLGDFVAALIDGTTQLVNPAYVIAADMNGDLVVNGNDLQEFVLAVISQ